MNAPQLLQFASFAHYLAPRPRDAHKGLFGHVLVVGGEQGFSGAVAMAAEAALRIGAGKVSIATRPEHASLLSTFRPELMCHGVTSIKSFLPLLNQATVIVAGPGLGNSAWAKTLFSQVVNTEKPMVVDADACQMLANQPFRSHHRIITPHPGEASRLLNRTSDAIQADRIEAIKALQQKLGGVCLLKGANTLIMGEDQILSYCNIGNPGMATAGMGDVLSGMIAGLLAQHVPLLEAAQLGVLLHAKAGDLASEAGERGMIATDLFPFFRRLVNGGK